MIAALTAAAYSWAVVALSALRPPRLLPPVPAPAPKALSLEHWRTAGPVEF
jgi:hypothetical protein